MEKFHNVQFKMLFESSEDSKKELIDTDILQKENEKKFVMINQNQKELESQKMRYKDLEAKYISLLNRLSEERKKTLEAEASHQKIKYELALIQQSNQITDENLKKLQNSTVDLKGKKKRELILINKRKLTQAAHVKKRKELEASLDVQEKLKKEHEIKIRQSYAEKVVILQSQAFSDKEKLTKEVKTYYENEFRKKDIEIQLREVELEREQKKKTKLLLKIDADSFEKLKLQVLELKQAYLTKEKTLSELREQHQEYENRCSKIKLQNEKSRAQLMQMEQHLGPEIEAYRLLVETMESHSPSPKKRKKPEGAIIRIEKFTAKFIRIKNIGYKEIQLSGWQLKSKAAKTEYIFPMFFLQPNSSLKIWTKFDDKKVDSDLVWFSMCEKLLPVKDEIQLVNAGNSIVDRVNISQVKQANVSQVKQVKQKEEYYFRQTKIAKIST